MRARYWAVGLVAAAAVTAAWAGNPTPTPSTTPATAAPAATLKLRIDAEVKATEQFVIIVPDTDAVSVVYVGLDGLDPFPTALLKDSRQFVLYTRGIAEGRYRFAAVGASATGAQARVNFTVVIGKPPPGPKPDGPVDDIRNDPRFAEVNNAYNADPSPTRQPDLRALAAAYKAVAAQVATAGTPRDYGAAVRTARLAAVGDRLDAVRKVFEAEAPLRVPLPPDPDTPLTAEQRNGLRDQLTRFGRIYEEVAK